MDASPPLAIPRLRLPRYSPQSQALSPIAGPSHSHNPDYLHADEDDEDAESTPRMSTSAIPDKSSPRSPATPSLPSEPTARLRALLARVPNSPNGATPHARPPLTLPSFSEPESDFEPPHSTATASSIARESLKEIFSHALRDPGNTPRKNGRPRRNSIDASEVEASPRVEEERAKYKGKRRTLSDEEAEKSSEYTYLTTTSYVLLVVTQDIQIPPRCHIARLQRPLLRLSSNVLTNRPQQCRLCPKHVRVSLFFAG